MIYDIIKYLLAAILSVFTGTIVYAITKFILDSALEQRIIVSDIAFYLHNLPNRMLAPALREERREEISPLIRELASKLIMTQNKIPFYNFLECIRIVKCKSNIVESSKLLIGISNTIVPSPDENSIPNERRQEVYNDIEKVCNLLGIKYDIRTK